jgi:hypothetical protein
MIHCGCVFWHLRRFSKSAFYESQSVLLATLALWAYSYYASRSRTEDPQTGVDQGDTSPSAADPASVPSAFASSNADPAFIWLDRPNDDEMVQCFVRSGRPDHMKAYVSGVGDIYEPEAPAKILLAGLNILETVSYAWGRDVQNVDLLQQAARFMQTSRSQ